MTMNRRAVLGGLAGLLVAGGMGSTVQAAEAKKEEAKKDAGGRFAQAGGDFSWKPQKLDFKEVQDVAHAGYHHKGYG